MTVGETIQRLALGLIGELGLYVPSGVVGLEVHVTVEGPELGAMSFEAAQVTPAGMPEKLKDGAVPPAQAPDAVSDVVAWLTLRPAPSAAAREMELGLAVKVFGSPQSPFWQTSPAVEHGVAVAQQSSPLPPQGESVGVGAISFGRSGLNFQESGELGGSDRPPRGM